MSTPSSEPSWLRRYRALLIAGGLVVCVAVAWVLLAGQVLVRSDELGSPQVVFSLSGDPLGYRLRAAAELVETTGADRLVVLSAGPGGIYDWQPVAMEFLQDEGIPPDIVRFMGPVRSTADEAAMAAGYVERCGWTEVAVATSPYHTRRAGWLFERAIGDDVTVTVVPSSELFDRGAWWRTDAGRESVLLEWIKGVSSVPYLLVAPEAIDTDVPC